jgi:hypothetical protein
MIKEEGYGGCGEPCTKMILSDILHRRPDVVLNEQGSSHLTRRVRGARKLVGENMIRLGS